MGTEDTLGDFERAWGGDEEAFERLLARLRRRIVLWVAARLSPQLRAHVEPEDVAQEVLLAVHRDFRSLRGGGYASFLAWVFKVAANRIRDLADRHGALKRRPTTPPEPEPRTSPSGAAGRNEQFERVRRAVEGLSDLHREVVVLLKFEEVPAVEAARILGRTENAVHVLLCRALKELRSALGGDPKGPGGVPAS